MQRTGAPATRIFSPVIVPRACGTIGHQVSESNRLPALRTKPISRLETDGVRWFWQSFGKVNSAILLKGRARCLSDYRRQLTSTFITESPHPHGPGVLQNASRFDLPSLISRSTWFAGRLAIPGRLGGFKQTCPCRLCHAEIIQVCLRRRMKGFGAAWNAKIECGQAGAE